MEDDNIGVYKIGKTAFLIIEKNGSCIKKGETRLLLNRQETLDLIKGLGDFVTSLMSEIKQAQEGQKH